MALKLDPVDPDTPLAVASSRTPRNWALIWSRLVGLLEVQRADDVSQRGNVSCSMPE